MRVLALGDSWAQLGVNHLVAELGDGWDVRLRAKTGDTACHWAKKWAVASGNSSRSGLAKLLDEHAPVSHVWLSLGANDVRASDRYAEAAECLKNVSNELLAYRPVIKVAQFSYDFLCFSTFSPAYGAQTPHCRDSTNATCFNERMRRVHTEIIAPAGRGSPRHRVYDLQGTLQAAAAIAGAPRLDAYSPRSYFLGDCTHPNADGFRVLFKELLRRRAFQI